MSFGLVLGLVFTLHSWAAPQDSHPDSASINASAKLMLIMDDIGYNRRLGERVVSLPGPINCAFLPHTPFAKRLAEHAHRNGHTVMLHAPMANENGARLGPGALLQTMSPQQLQASLQQSLDSIPYVTGVNNHMGSLLTQNASAMQPLLELVQQQGLFFVDSITSPNSVALRTAKALQLPALGRDVFLDHSQQPEDIAHQFERAIQHAKAHGAAVLIGHPYPNSLDFLEQTLPTLHEQGVELTAVDDFLKQQLHFWAEQSKPQSSSRFQLHISLPAVMEEVEDFGDSLSLSDNGGEIR